VAGCLVRQNDWGRGFLAPRGRYRAYMLGIAWPMKSQGGGCKLSMCGEVKTKVEVQGCRVRKNNQGAGFWPREADTERTHSVSPGALKIKIGIVKGVWGVRLPRYLW
jgi:hypothetical protein